MDILTILDIVVLVLAIVCIFLSVRIYQLIKGNGRIITALAFVYLAVVRGMVVYNDTVAGGNYHFPTTQLAIGFYVLIAVGLGYLLREIKSMLYHGGNGKEGSNARHSDSPDRS